MKKMAAQLVGLLATGTISSTRFSEFKESAIYAFGPVGLDEYNFEATTSFGWYREMEGRNALSAALRSLLARVLPKRVVVLARRLPALIAAIVCVVRDHDLVDDGYGTPESGCIDLSCRRCERSFGRTVLY